MALMNIIFSELVSVYGDGFGCRVYHTVIVDRDGT